MDPRIDASLAQWLFESATSGLLLVDLAAREVLAANACATRMLATDPAELSDALHTQWPHASADAHPPAALPLASAAGTLQLEFAGWISRGLALYRVAFVQPATTDNLPDAELRKYSVGPHSERESLIRELEARNSELERFAYTVSHDLKSPLITITGFLGFLERDIAENNVHEIQTDMHMISSAADTMKRLLDDILELSRIGRIVHPGTPVDLTDVAQEVCAALAARIEKSGTHVVVAPKLPTVSGDRTRLIEVLLNLVDNALKFSAHAASPRVEIGTLAGGVLPLFYVRDNGIGMLPEHFARVFNIFEKLDSGSDGTGIGLAIVRRIVDVHGGRVWVESQGENQGCTFWISMPAP